VIFAFVHTGHFGDCLDRSPSLLRVNGSYSMPLLCPLLYNSVVWNCCSSSSLDRLCSLHHRLICGVLDMFTSDIDYDTACSVFGTHQVSRLFLANDIRFFLQVLSSTIDAPDLLNQINFNVRSPKYFHRPGPTFLPVHTVLKTRFLGVRLR